MGGGYKIYIQPLDILTHRFINILWGGGGVEAIKFDHEYPMSFKI